MSRVDVRSRRWFLTFRVVRRSFATRVGKVRIRRILRMMYRRRNRARRSRAGSRFRGRLAILQGRLGARAIRFRGFCADVCSSRSRFLGEIREMGRSRQSELRCRSGSARGDCRSSSSHVLARWIQWLGLLGSVSAPRLLLLSFGNSRRDVPTPSPTLGFRSFLPNDAECLLALVGQSFGRSSH